MNQTRRWACWYFMTVGAARITGMAVGRTRRILAAVRAFTSRIAHSLEQVLGEHRPRIPVMEADWFSDITRSSIRTLCFTELIAPTERGACDPTRFMIMISTLLTF